MSHKEDVKQSISHDIMIENLQTVYKCNLEDSKKTGQSISSITYQMLETIEENYDKHKLNIEVQLIKASTIIVQLIVESAQKNITEKEKKLASDYASLRDTIESEILHLLESIETLEAYANDQSHIYYKKSLSHIKSDIINRIHEFKTLLAHYSTDEG